MIVWRRFLRYGAIGLIATAVHYSLVIFVVERLGAAPWAASGAGAIVGAQVAYVGNRRYTFADLGNTHPSWLPFQVTALLGAATGMLVVACAVQFGAHYMIGQAAATAVTVALTFAINRRWTFA